MSFKCQVFTQIWVCYPNMAKVLISKQGLKGFTFNPCRVVWLVAPYHLKRYSCLWISQALLCRLKAAQSFAILLPVMMQHADAEFAIKRGRRLPEGPPAEHIKLYLDKTDIKSGFYSNFCPPIILTKYIHLAKDLGKGPLPVFAQGPQITVRPYYPAYFTLIYHWYCK